MIGWVTEGIRERGHSPGSACVHGSPLCGRADLVPVEVNDGQFWARRSHVLVRLPWCVHCRPPESPGDWADMAACKGLPQEWFFIGSQGHGYNRGRKVCATCSVIEDCREFALRTLPEYGLWGGWSPDERRQMIQDWVAPAGMGG
jgi:WhiB family redox-sensing transcriptional regulator